MKNQSILSCHALSIILVLISVQLKGQFIVEQTSHEIPYSYSLVPEDVEFESEEDEMAFVLKIPLEALKTAARNDGLEITEEKSTMYLDGERFAVESYSDEMGRVTMVSDGGTGNIQMIMWEQKMIIDLNPEDVEKMEEQTKEAVEEMIKDMPPEMQEQVRAEMLSEKNTSGVKYTPLPTGESNQINGFNCDEYLVQGDGEISSVWVTEDAYGIIEEVKNLSDNFDELFALNNEDEGFDEWQLIPGKVPVQVRSFSNEMMMGDPAIFIMTISNIEKKKPPVEVFRIPDESEGFSKVSYMEMMQNMMEEADDY